MVNDLLLSDVPLQRHASFATKVLNFIRMLVSDNRLVWFAKLQNEPDRFKILF